MSDWSEEDQQRLEDLDDAVSHGALELGPAEPAVLEADMMWLIGELKKARNLNKTLNHNWDNLAMELVAVDEVMKEARLLDDPQAFGRAVIRVRQALEDSTLGSHAADLREMRAQTKRAEGLAKACQIVMGCIGDEDGYLPTIGALGTDEIRQLMREADVEPIYYSF